MQTGSATSRASDLNAALKGTCFSGGLLRQVKQEIGIVGLVFSCDGSHYIPTDEFLSEACKF